MSSCRGHTQVLGDVLLHGGAPSEQKRIKFGAANWLQCSWDFCPSAFLLEANVALSRAEAVLPLFLHEVPLVKTQAACCTFTWTSTSSLLRLRCTCK